MRSGAGAADGRGLPAAGLALAHLAHGRLRARVCGRHLLLEVAQVEEVDAAARRAHHRHAPLACARAQRAPSATARLRAG